MRLLAVILSAILTIVLIVFGISQFKDSKDTRLSILSLEQQLQKEEKNIELMRSFKSAQGSSLTKVFHKFSNMIEVLANFNHSSVMIGIPGYKEHKNIEEFFSQSELKGVKMVSLKIIFKDLKDPLDSMAILAALNDSLKDLSFEIISIASHSDKLEIIANLYGV